MLLRLCYVSRIAAPLDHDALHALLRASRAANVAAGITGALCHTGSAFLQVIEGSRSAVNALYLRIAADRRHRDLELLAYDEISERRFAGWSMGVVNLARVNPALLLKYAPQVPLDPYTLCAPAVQALFDDLIATASIIGERG